MTRRPCKYGVLLLIVHKIWQTAHRDVEKTSLSAKKCEINLSRHKSGLRPKFNYLRSLFQATKEVMRDLLINRLTKKREKGEL